MQQIVSLLSPIPSIKAIVLGGSHARGTARPHSDLDIGLYYSEDEPLDIDAVREVAIHLSKKGSMPTVTNIYEWGAWVNGGAWIAGEEKDIDFLYRSIEQVERVIDEAKVGKNQCDFAQQPPFGYYSVTYLGETKSCQILFDPHGLVARLKEKVQHYPEPLRKAIVQDNLWAAEFGILFAKKAQKDLYTLSGCIVRVLSHLTQVLYALNRIYFISDREAMNDIVQPPHYKEDVESILRGFSIGELEMLFLKVKDLAAHLYETKYLLD